MPICDRCSQCVDVCQGVLSKDKHELLFRDHQINYNNEPEMFRRGSVLIRHMVCSCTWPVPSEPSRLTSRSRARAQPVMFVRLCVSVSLLIV